MKHAFLLCWIATAGGLSFSTDWDSGASLSIPQVAAGGGYETVILVVNTDDSSGHAFYLYAYPDDPKALADWKANGQVFGGPNGNAIAFGLNPRQGLRITMTGGADTVSGFAEIDPYTLRRWFAVAVFYNYRDGGGDLVSTVGVGVSPEWYKHYALPVERSSSIDLGLAVMSRSTGTASYKVTLSLYDQSGNPVQQVERSLKANGHLIGLLKDIFPAIPDGDFRGSITVESFVYIQIAALRIDNLPGGLFLMTSTQPAPQP